MNIYEVILIDDIYEHRRMYDNKNEAIEYYNKLRDGALPGDVIRLKQWITPWTTEILDRFNG